MPTFIDESGDTGHEPDSSRYFRLAAVWLPTHEIVEAFRSTIQHLRRELALPAGYEFKFAKTSTQPDRRRAFFLAALDQPFRFAVASLDKQSQEWRAAERTAIHWACAVSLAAALGPIYRDEEESRAAAGRDRPLNELIVVDDNQDREFLAAIKCKFRELRSARHSKRALVGKVKFRGSRPDESLQLADMVCGAVAANLDGKSDWYDLICDRNVRTTCIP